MAFIFFDFDSTVVKKETLDDAIASALSAHPERERLVKEVEEITRLGMEGKINFLDSIQRRLKVVPLSRELIQSRGQEMLEEITDGIPEVFDYLRAAGHDVHIVSGGFSEYIEPVAQYLAVTKERQHTNHFTYTEDGVVNGTDETSLLWTNEGKTPVLRALRTKHPEGRFVMIGDGYNDLKAYESGAADVFIGFGANVVRESVKANAQLFVYSAPELLTILKKEV